MLLNNFSITRLIPFHWYHLIDNSFVSMVLRNTDINNDYTDDFPGKVQTFFKKRKEAFRLLFCHTKLPLTDFFAVDIIINFYFCFNLSHIVLGGSIPLFLINLCTLSGSYFSNS